MRVQSAIGSAAVAITRTITVAAGVFAPGHLGELTQEIPFDLVDGVLADCGAVQSRLRLLPSRVAVYFVLALGLFPDCGYLGVWARLTAALGEGIRAPSAKALREARRRTGIAPVRALFHALAGPAAPPGTPGVCFGRFRTVAFDGCESVRAADTAANRRWLGATPARGGRPAAYPALRLMTLAETGTRALLGAAFGPRSRHEVVYASWLLHLLTRDMLVLTDRAFDTPLLAQIAARAEYLARLKAVRKLPVMAWLPDGSFLSGIDGVQVRIILADVTVRLADGRCYGDRYRLATTLTDHRRYPAKALARLYHERWEHEVTYLALRHTLLHRRVLRSGDPGGVEQELWALLTLYQAIRRAMVTAARAVPGTDPDRGGFTIALQAARDTVTAASGVITPAGPPGRIAAAVMTALLPPRRLRVSDRKVRSAGSRYINATPARPARSTPVRTIDITLSNTDNRAKTGRKPTLTKPPEP